jgi:hypothetical protein
LSIVFAVRRALLAGVCHTFFCFFSLLSQKKEEKKIKKNAKYFCLFLSPVPNWGQGKKSKNRPFLKFV